MIEPPVPGFTGVVWEARRAEKLATDLTTGAGTAPIADAVAAWTRLGAEFGTAALDFDRMVADLRRAWHSDHGALPLDRLTDLREWFLAAARAAAANAVRTGEHLATYEAAVLAMPHPDELAALIALRETISQVGSALGAPLVASMDDIEKQQQIAEPHAGRVMRTYESANESLAAPWEREQPPVIASDSALQAERTAQEQSARPAPLPATAARAAGFPRLPMVSAVRELSSYRTASVVQNSATASSPAPTPGVQTDTGMGRMAPGALAPAATTGPPEREHRGAACPGPADTGAVDLADPIQVAPAVLGAVDLPAAVVPQERGTGG